MKKWRIGVLSSGGDCPGINAAIKWVVNAALDEQRCSKYGYQFEVVGIRGGWKGLIGSPEEVSEGFWKLDTGSVRNWDRVGGTLLGTTRTNPFDHKNDQSKVVIDNVRKLRIDVIIAIGGDGTQSINYRFSQEGINVIGIPKTIDGDLEGTDYTLGYESALNVIVEDIDKLRTTAGSHQRIFVVETMGRNAGWLALEGGEAAGAFMILIPEHDFSVEKVNELLLKGKESGDRYEIVVVSEGAKPLGGSQVTKSNRLDGYGHKSLGGIGSYLATEIQKGTGLEARSQVLSYLQRGGAPCAYDRRMGRYFGIAAVDMIMRQEFGRMVSLSSCTITSVPLKEVYASLKQVDVATRYDTERYNGRRRVIN
jgi:6-phosphofructokinase 1